MSEINKDRLRNKIVKSKELTALEKRYLEELIGRDKPPDPVLPEQFKSVIMERFTERR